MRWQAIGIAIIAVAIIGLIIYRGSQFPPETCQFVQYRWAVLHLRLAPRRSVLRTSRTSRGSSPRSSHPKT